MYSYETDLDVIKLETEGQVTRLFLGNDIVIEIPSRFSSGIGKRVHLKISEEKDDPSKWSIYMWGIVYASSENSYKASAGGFIISINNVSNAPQVGTKLYIGIKY